jgi:uncharacterized protein YggE
MLAEATERQIKNDCLTEAVTNARAKAQKMVEAAGGKLGALITVAEGGYTPMPIYANQGRMLMKADMAMAEAAPVPSIQAGSTNMTVQVNASFYIE